MDKRIQLGNVYSLISTLVMGEFYGELSLRFEHGNIVHVRSTQNFKIGDVSGSKGVRLLIADGADTSCSNS